MTGLEDFNYPAFNAAEDRLQYMGCHVFNPASLGAHDGWTHGDYIREGAQELVRCDTLVLLPGWETSTGAVQELMIARALNMDVYLYCDIVLTDNNRSLGIWEPWPKAPTELLIKHLITILIFDDPSMITSDGFKIMGSLIKDIG